MPGSSTFGKLAIATTIVKLSQISQLGHVVDIGPGMGAYADILRPHLKDTKFTCIEIWGPYVTGYELHNKYDRAIVGDARMIDYKLLPAIDVCIAGDVLEHMTFAEGAELVNRIFEHCDVVISSTPALYASQGEYCGNPWETHVEEYYTEEATRKHFPYIVEYIFESYIGVTFMAKSPHAVERLKSALGIARALVQRDYDTHGYVEDFNYDALRARLQAILANSDLIKN